MRGLVRRVVAAADRLFFRSVDARSLAAFRIALGFTVLVTHLCLLPEIDTLLGQGAELWVHKGPRFWYEWSLYDGISSPGTLRAAHLALGVGPLLLMLGVGGRLSTLAALFTQIMVFHGNGVMLNSGDLLLRLWTWLLLLAPATRVWSLDAWWARRRGRPLPAVLPVFTHRLITLQLAVMYFDTGIEKFLGDEWTGGRATYYSLHVERLQRFPDWTTPAFDLPVMVYASAVMTYVTVAWEVLWPLLILWRPTRRLALGLGVLIHGGIALTMMVAQFSAASVMGYLAVLDPDRVGAWLDRRRASS